MNRGLRCGLVMIGALVACDGPFSFSLRELEKCTPGATRCHGEGRLICNADGQGFTSVPCDVGTCREGYCMICTPGETTCIEGERQICDTLGQPSPVPCPESAPLCSDGRCGCEPDSWRCGPEGREQCTPEGSEYVSVACPADLPLCHGDGACVACEPGSSRCTDSGRELCSDGLHYEALTCAEDDTCIAGFFTGSGDGFTCVTTRCGSAYCWGRNDRGQLGDQRATDASPRRIAVGAAVTQGSLGARHACALRVDGVVVCWGGNDRAQAHSGGPNEPPIAPPGPIGVGAGVTRLESGPIHNCVILDDGRVQCWGDPIGLKLGWDSSAHIMPPVPADETGATFLTGAIDLGLSVHTSCALVAGGDLYCWGSLYRAPYFGSYGYPPGTFATDVISVNGGWTHLVADSIFGPIATQASDCGQCGIVHGYLEIFHPLAVASGAQLAPGQLTTCARVGGSLSCWGDNRHGQLGIGGPCVDDIIPNDDIDHPLCGAVTTTPQTVALPGPAVDVSAGYGHTCALVDDGRELVPYCFGEASLGELGAAAESCASTAVAVPWPPQPGGSP